MCGFHITLTHPAYPIAFGSKHGPRILAVANAMSRERDSWPKKIAAHGQIFVANGQPSWLMAKALGNDFFAMGREGQFSFLTETFTVWGLGLGFKGFRL